MPLLAFAVDDLAASRAFRGGVMGCAEGLSDDWIELNFSDIEMRDWEVLRMRPIVAGVRFEIEPHIRFKEQPNEQATIHDPSGDAIEMKAFAALEQLFTT